MWSVLLDIAEVHYSLGNLSYCIWFVPLVSVLQLLYLYYNCIGIPSTLNLDYRGLFATNSNVSNSNYYCSILLKHIYLNFKKKVYVCIQYSWGRDKVEEAPKVWYDSQWGTFYICKGFLSITFFLPFPYFIFHSKKTKTRFVILHQCFLLISQSFFKSIVLYVFLIFIFQICYLQYFRFFDSIIRRRSRFASFR